MKLFDIIIGSLDKENWKLRYLFMQMTIWFFGRNLYLFVYLRFKFKIFNP